MWLFFGQPNVSLYSHCLPFVLVFCPLLSSLFGMSQVQLNWLCWSISNWLYLFLFFPMIKWTAPKPSLLEVSIDRLVPLPWQLSPHLRSSVYGSADVPTSSAGQFTFWGWTGEDYQTIRRTSNWWVSVPKMLSYENIGSLWSLYWQPFHVYRPEERLRPISRKRMSKSSMKKKWKRWVSNYKECLGNYPLGRELGIPYSTKGPKKAPYSNLFSFSQ